MKKTVFLLFTFLAVNISAIAQCNQRPNADHYLLQGNTYLHADEIDLDAVDSNGNYATNVGPLVYSRRPDTRSTLYDYAQQQYSDTLRTIIGISAFLTHHYYDTMTAYLCIADTNFNICRRVSIPNDSVDCNYTELFFNRPINVEGDFFLIWDNPKPDTSSNIYHFNNNYDFFCNRPTLLASWITKDTTNYGLYTRYILSDGTISSWHLYGELSGQTLVTYVAYLFPIFSELDTTLSLVGQTEDTITQPEDTASLAIVNMVDKYSHIFPNPAKEELNIQCSFKISDIEIYNSLGQKILLKNVNKYNSVVNVTNFRKGTYFIKINTANGVANKKFIVQ